MKPLFGYRHGKGWTLLHDPDAQAKAASPQACSCTIEAGPSSVRPGSRSAELSVPSERPTLRSVHCARVIEYHPDLNEFAVRDETRHDRPTLAKCKTVAEAQQIARER